MAKDRVDEVLTNLCAHPWFQTVVLPKEAKELLLRTNGWVMCRGEARTIRTRDIGLGVHEVRTVPQDDDGKVSR